MSDEWKSASSPPSILYAEGSLARTSAALADVPVLKASVRDCGPNSFASLATFDPATSSWRTSQGCLFEGWAEFSESWPAWGMTASGIAYRLPRSVPRIYDRASLYWPTIVGTEAKRGTKYRYKQAQTMSLSCALGGPPNPTWAEWFMGFPIGWTDLPDSETP